MKYNLESSFKTFSWYLGDVHLVYRKPRDLMVLVRPLKLNYPNQNRSHRNCCFPEPFYPASNGTHTHIHNCFVYFTTYESGTGYYGNAATCSLYHTCHLLHSAFQLACSILTEINGIVIMGTPTDTIG